MLFVPKSFGLGL